MPRPRARKPAKPAATAPPRSDMAVAARYTGVGHATVACAIGRCDWQLTAANYHTARAMVAAHWEKMH